MKKTSKIKRSRIKDTNQCQQFRAPVQSYFLALLLFPHFLIRSRFCQYLIYLCSAYPLQQITLCTFKKFFLKLYKLTQYSFRVWSLIFKYYSLCHISSFQLWKDFQLPKDPSKGSVVCLAFQNPFSFPFLVTSPHCCHILWSPGLTLTWYLIC